MPNKVLLVANRRWPDLVCLMLTGNADQQTAMDAVNQGAIFRFLTIPALGFFAIQHFGPLFSLSTEQP